MTGFMRELSKASSRNHLFTCCRPHSLQFRPSSSSTTRPGVQHTTKAPGGREKQATGAQTSGCLCRGLLAQPPVSGQGTLGICFDNCNANAHLSPEHVRLGLWEANSWEPSDYSTFYCTFLPAYSGLAIRAYTCLLLTQRYTHLIC